MIVGSGGLYSTADDILRWIAWHLDRFAPAGAEMRLLDHAAYVQRDDLNPVFGLDESGHDYFLQVTDARPDTGGLSGATPQEAMTWGKVDPNQLPDTVTCYLDSTVFLPILTVYAQAKCAPRKPRRLMDRLADLMTDLEAGYLKNRKKNRKE